MCHDNLPIRMWTNVAWIWNIISFSVAINGCRKKWKHMDDCYGARRGTEERERESVKKLRICDNASTRVNDKWVAALEWYAPPHAMCLFCAEQFRRFCSWFSNHWTCDVRCDAMANEKWNMKPAFIDCINIPKRTFCYFYPNAKSLFLIQSRLVCILFSCNYRLPQELDEWKFIWPGKKKTTNFIRALIYVWSISLGLNNIMIFSFYHNIILMSRCI